MRPLSLLALLTLAAPLSAQATLHQQISSIAQDAQGKVFVACSLPGVALDCDLNAHGHPPMQSTFKLPLAIVVLQQVERGKLALDQPIRFLPSDRYPGTYSPLQDAHPDANVDVPLSELLQLAVGKSDNTAADILLRILGGPEVVQDSLNKLGLRTIHVRDSERGLHDDFQAQYRNDAEPAAMVALLRLLADHSPLNAEHTALLNRWMTESTTGLHRIKGLLPADTLVAHKTGTSGERNGLTPANNDVGLITLPNGHRLALAVFVIDSRADETTREAVIARIAKVIYDQALAATKP
ncbi:class A beta-lactamase [Granulicella sp. S156]|jgi:beta-lactamase class A|uniref:class A beta-lactamase n=1 Tax=Granulicella sp. S156 TaxID=1747224 RepID=UPI00131CB206|nr:class A beta-lactamase [Granulicella sp. S156]